MRLSGLCLLLSIPAANLVGQTAPQHRPRVALVLEGGGALGFAHIGAIQYLEEHHIPVDLVVGTSMGGLVGGLYAIGKSPAEIQQLTQEIDWDSVLSGRTAYQELSFRRKEDRLAFQNRLQFGIKHKSLALPEGLNSGNKVGAVLDRTTLAYKPDLNFDSFPIPFRCVATDLSTWKEKIFDKGSISSALRATMSIPTVFAPVTVDGHVYTDGGAVNNLPVDVAKQAGADVVIAVYLDQGPPDPETSSTLFSVAARNVSIMIAANEMRNIQAADILISADLRGFTSASFTSGPQIVPKGYEAAQKKERMLAALALNPKDWQEYIVARDAKTARAVPIPQFLEVVGNRPDYNEVLRKNLQPYIGKPIDPPALERSLDEVTGMGRMNSIGYTTVARNGHPGLQVRTYDKNYGPPFLNFAINIDGSSPQQVLFGMAARLTFLDLGGYRAEWRTDAFFGSTYGVRSEYYKPFTGNSRFFVAPHLYADESTVNLYALNDRFAQYRIGQDGLGLDIGYAINSRSEFRMGQDLLWFKTRANIASQYLPNSSERQETTTMRYRYYGTDNAALPMQGLLVDSKMSWTQRPTGRHNFPLAELQVGYFLPVSKKASLIFRAYGGTTFGAGILDLGLQSFTLGGPFRFGAYDPNELLTNQYYLLQGGYERKLMSFSPLLGEGLYAVGLFEGGRIYQALPGVTGLPLDGSVAIVARTAAGPVFLGAAIGDAGHRKWWFGMGRTF